MLEVNGHRSIDGLVEVFVQTHDPEGVESVHERGRSAAELRLRPSGERHETIGHPSVILITCPRMHEFFLDCIASLFIQRGMLRKVVLDLGLPCSERMKDQVSEQEKGNDGYYVPIEPSWRRHWESPASRKGHYTRFEHVMSFDREQQASFADTDGQCSLVSYTLATIASRLDWCRQAIVNVERAALREPYSFSKHRASAVVDSLCPRAMTVLAAPATR